MKRNGIALLITLMFIIAFSSILALSLANVKEGSKQSSEARFIVQSDAIIKDVLTLLKANPMLKEVSSAETLEIFLLSAEMIPLSVDQYSMLITIKSASNRLNINDYDQSEQRIYTFNTFLQKYNVGDIQFFNDLLSDAKSGYQEFYKTSLFEDKPNLYREYITSKEHFNEIIDYYMTKRHDSSVKHIPWDQVIMFSSEQNSSIDFNHANAELLRFLLPNIDEAKAIEIAESAEVFDANNTILSDEEKGQLEVFNVFYYVPTVLVTIKILNNDNPAQNAKISFKYRISSGTGYDFEINV